MHFGPELLPGGGVLFHLWAPGVAHVALVRDGASQSERPMTPQPGGWHTLRADDAGPGTRYRFRLLDGPQQGLLVPDPASRRNPEGPHGPSEVVDADAYAWRDTAWRGRPWHEAVVYELHVGTFTPEGSFAAAAARLPELAALGFTAVQLMPLAQPEGTRGWGYDGVLPFAPMAAYGTPDDLRALVDQAHGLGLMVLLDVVYNHFGPDGNYLHAYCPDFFDPEQPTPWGPAIRFEGEGSAPVRAFFVANALYWTVDFHIDGLRLDAVHQIRDRSPTPIVEQIVQALAAGPGRQRPVHVVLENEENQASRLLRDEQGAPRGATAQWNDDLHHCAHVLLTGESEGYYADYAGLPEGPVQGLARALAEGFVYQGQPAGCREGRPRGEPSAALSPLAFVSHLQTHDQVGNRALGERIGQLGDARRLDMVYACLLLSPHVPMLFMGEEFAASTPFLYFCDFHGELGAAVSKGRRAEFSHFAAFADPQRRAQIPDPNDAATFARSALRWDERASGPHHARLELVRRLLALRREHLVPRLAGAMRGGVSLGAGSLVHVRWRLADGSGWDMAANLGDAACVLPPAAGATTVWPQTTTSPDRLEPWTVRVLHQPETP